MVFVSVPLCKIPTVPVQVGSTSVQPVYTIRNPEVQLDANVSMRTHVTVVLRIRQNATIIIRIYNYDNKKHLKNVGPIRDCEPPHAHSPGVATGTVAHHLRIDVHDDNDNA